MNRAADGREISWYYLGKVSEYLRCGNLMTYLAEIRDNQAFISEIESSVKGVDSFQQQFDSIYDFRFYRILIYSLVREFAPRNVVETGVLHGLTTKFILEAIAKNGNGTLFSIDLPSPHKSGPSNRDGYYHTLPADKQPGWVIAEESRSNWVLSLGSSREKLLDVLNACGEIDFFIHDSEHTYDTMWFEVVAAWKHLKDEGILICDNVESNSALADFCRKVHRRPLFLPAPDSSPSMQTRFALIQK